MSYKEITAGLSKEDFLKRLKEVDSRLNLTMISKAYDLAKKAHEGQKRESGEDYFVHLTEVAYIVATLKSDTVTVVSALLHDTLEDTKLKPEVIEREFGKEVLEIVQAVTKIQNIKFAHEENVAENIRKVILATSKDFRVIVVKLADRLHNMRTLRFTSKEKQRRIAKETLEIYVPIAYKLGMSRIKSEMEDLCLKYLNSEVYEDLKKKIGMKKNERELFVKELVNELSKTLKENHFDVEITGRAKSFYSLYRKMVRKSKSFNEIYDLFAARIITNSVEDCYKILGFIHTKYKPLIGHFKDYIAMPKANGYQSLHTVILYHKRPVEIQIRTKKMHYEAEDGIAAHWRYKGTERDKQFDQRISWLKRILTWLKDSKNAKQFVDDLKVDLFKDEIVVLTPKGDPIILTEGSTPVDFAYAVHTDLGNHCDRAKVNGKLVGLDYKLESGDVVEIMTKKNGKPSRSWLRFVKTRSAAAKIRKALHIKKDETAPLSTKEMTESEIIDLINLKGFKKSKVHLAKCCNPKYGDSIIGIRTKDGKLMVHKSTCANQYAIPEKQRFILSWKPMERKNYYILTISFIDRVGLIVDILNTISKRNINIESVKSRSSGHNALLNIRISLFDDKIIDDLASEIRNINNILNVEVKKENELIKKDK